MDLEAAVANAQTRTEENAMRWDGATLPDTAWGFFSYPDGPAALGGGMVFPSWLESRDDALDHIADILPFHPPNMASEQVAEQTRQVVDRMKSGDLDDVAGVHLLNEYLAGLSQITFFGSLESLVSGTDEFARSYRADFLNIPEGAPVPAVPAARLDEFKEWLVSYGVL